MKHISNETKTPFVVCVCVCVETGGCWVVFRVTRSMTLKRRTLGSKKEDNPKKLLTGGDGGH